MIGSGMYYFCGPMKTFRCVVVWNILRHESGSLYFMFHHYSLLPFWDWNIDRNSTYVDYGVNIGME